jgi:hypothetical protein
MFIGKPSSFTSTRRSEATAVEVNTNHFGPLPKVRYLLMSVHPEGDTTLKYLPPVLPDQPDSGDRRNGQKTHVA